jgi:chorismate dehydratase
MSHVRSRLPVGAVNYLNTKPLVHGLAEGSPNIELGFDLPSRLADGLAAGRWDVALIPSVEYFAEPLYRVVSDACIACRGPVMSVKLYFRVPPNQVRTLALDEGSRTSVALGRILLNQRFGLNPDTVALPIGEGLHSTTADAVLLIGDRAIHSPSGNFVEIWDLGDEWFDQTGLPFVFAMWVARPGVDLGDLAARLSHARDEGVANLEAIARVEAPRHGLTVPQCLTYLRDNLHFYLGAAERRGLDLFHQQASQLGLLEETARSES